jgi:hypothetical protein
VSRFHLNHKRSISFPTASEKWVNNWVFTGSLLDFPGGGKAGFYRRFPRVGKGRSVPPAGRVGVLCLYPKTRYEPVLIYKKHVYIKRANSFLIIGIAANKNPVGELILRVFINGNRLGGDVFISGKEGWREMVFNLSEFLGLTVDIDIGVYSHKMRPAHVYIDYIHLEDSAIHPVNAFNDYEVDTNDAAVPFVGEENYFDGDYLWFLETLWQREDKRRQFMRDRYRDQYYCPIRPRNQYYSPIRH